MSDLEYPKDDNQWAWEKGLKRRCLEHGIDYDPHVGCPECLRNQRIEAEERRKKEREERKLAWEENSARIIWPDNKPPKLGKDKKKKKWWKF